MTKTTRFASLFLCLVGVASVVAQGCAADDDAERVGSGEQALGTDASNDTSGGSDVTGDQTLADSPADASTPSACRHIALSASGHYDATLGQTNQSDGWLQTNDVRDVNRPTPFSFAIPGIVPVVTGNGGTSGTLSLVFYRPNDTRVECIYDSGVSGLIVNSPAILAGNAYGLAKCTGNLKPGAVVQAVAVDLGVFWADQSQPVTVAVTLDEVSSTCVEPDGGTNEGGASDGSVDAGDSCGTFEMTAAQSYSPRPSQDGTSTTPGQLVTFAIPSTVTILEGSKSRQATAFQWRTGGGNWVTCDYAVYDGVASGFATLDSDGCDNGQHAGAIVTADQFNLFAFDALPSAGPSVVHLSLPELGCGDAGADAEAGVADASDASLDGAAEAASDAGADVDAADASCTPAQCDDANPCTTDSCGGIGQCTHVPVAAGTLCSDGNACNGIETCNASGTCTPGTPPVVDDGNACTIDSCDPITGVHHPAVAAGTSCSDGNACNGAETCNANGTCVAGTPPTVDDGNVCTLDSCDPANGVQHPPAPAGTTCSDGNACNGSETCNGSGACTPGTPPTLDDGNPCTTDACDATNGVMHTGVPVGTTCGDNSNRCLGASTCNASAQCTRAPPPVVDDGNPCTVDSCDPASGVHHPPAPAGTACGTNTNACVGLFLCDGSGACTQGPPPVVDDGNVCTVDSCDPATGPHHDGEPPGTQCGPGDACTNPSTCDANSTCQPGTPLPVDDGNVCTTDACDVATGAHHTPVTVGTACGDNSNKCAATHTCNAEGNCLVTPAPVIDTSNPCRVGTCDPATGVSYATVPHCDPTPTTDAPAEIRAAFTGKLVLSSGAAVSNYAITVFDAPVTATPRSDVVVTNTNGAFRVELSQFPTSEPNNVPPHHVIVRFDSPDFLPITRDAYLRPGDIERFGVITAKGRDPKVTVIGSEGGTATDSQNLMEVDIPPGALTTPTPIRITPIQNREEIPGKLPDATITTYAFELEPDGTQFKQPVTVRVGNYRNIPTNLQIPVGRLDRTTNEWRDWGVGTWDGAMFAFTTTHFTTGDMNLANANLLVMTVGRGNNKSAGGDGRCGMGSSVGLSSGGVRQSLPLPTYRRMNRDYGVGLAYDSFLTFGASGAAGGIHVATSLPSTGISVSFQCVPRSAADNIVASSAGGSCIAGACAGGAVGLPDNKINLVFPSDTAGGDDIVVTTNLPPGVTDFQTDIPLDMSMPSGDSVAESGYVRQTTTVNTKAGSCAGGGGPFGSTSSNTPATTPIPASSPNGQPIATYNRHVFLHHRHGSPYGVGWDVANISRLYKNSHADEAVLVSGSGDEEYFFPRVRTTTLEPTNGPSGTMHGVTLRAYARDAVTGETFVAALESNSIDRLDPQTGARTPVVTGAGLSGMPNNMAVTYVGGVRHFLVATETALIDVSQGGTPRTLMARSHFWGQDAQFAWIVPGIAARNNIAIYSEGNVQNPVLYRFDLSAPAPQPVQISRSGNETGVPQPDISLKPYGVTSSGFKFGDPHGLAFRADGALFIADRRRNAIYLLEPDVNGEISETSLVSHALGDGIGQVVTPVGHRDPAPEFSVNQPALLSTGPDGNLWIITAFGAAIYDLPTNEVRWVFVDAVLEQSEMQYSLLSGHNFGGSYVPTGPTQLLGDDSTAMLRLDVDLFSSETDPTRTLSFDTSNNATLTDTSSDLVEAYNSGGQLLQRQTRENDPIVAFTYTTPTSELVSSMIDPTGGTTTFSYASAGLGSPPRLKTITDPAGRTTTLNIDSKGDLIGITEPEGTTYQFAYQEHRVTQKTSPEGDVTTYVYDPDGGYVTTTIKPGSALGAETFTNIKPAYAQPPTHDAKGKTTYTGSYTDAHGAIHTYTVDERGRPIVETTVADGVTYAREDVHADILGPWNEPHEQRSNARTARTAYSRINGLALGDEAVFDTYGRLLGRTKSLNGPGSLLQSYAYGPDGRLTGFHPGPGNNSFGIGRDAAGHVARVYETGPGFAGRETDFTWRSDGLVATTTVHGVTTTFAYDETSDKNFQSTSDTLGRASAFLYDEAGRVRSSTVGSAPGSGDGTTTWTFGYDGLNRLRTVTDAAGNATTFGFTRTGCGCDQRDQINTIHTPDLAPGLDWTLTYGLGGQLVSVTDPDAFTQTFAYAPTGEVIASTDQNGHATTMTYDALGRLKTLTDPLLRAHERVYATPGANGFVGQDVLARSATTSIAAPLANGEYQLGTNAYDLFTTDAGFKRSRGWNDIELYRDATFELSYATAHDDAGRITRREDRAGAPVASSDPFGSGATGQYDQFSAQYLQSLPVPLVDTMTSDRSAGYDFGRYGYNAEYDVTSSKGFDAVSGTTGTDYTYTRDTAGRISAVDVSYRYFADSPSPHLGYSYYASGNIASDYAGPITYDARGLLHTHGDFTYDTYDAAGRNTSLTYPDGHKRLQGYDSEGRINSRCYTYANAALNRCYRASYDGVGNPVRMTDPEGTDVIGYDSLDRIITVTRTLTGATTPSSFETYDYNALGALKVNNGAAVDHQRRRLDGSGNADAAIPQSFAGSPIAVDLIGQVGSLAGNAFEYSRSGRLVVAGTNNPLSFNYDNAQQRTRTTFGGESVYDVYQSGNIVQHWVKGPNAANPGNTVWAPTQYIFDGVDHPLGTLGAEAEYFELDLAGNVRRLRGANGRDDGGYRYTAFGTLTPETVPAAIPGPLGVAFMWKGRPRIGVDNGIELYDMRARWWAPQLASFLSSDQFAYARGDSTFWGWGGQNPLRWSDPTGHSVTNVTVGFFSPQDTQDSFAASAYFAGLTTSDFQAGNYGSAAWNAVLSGATGLGGAVTQFFQRRPPSGADLAFMACPIEGGGGGGAGEGALLEPYGGPGGGHHVPAKSAFRGAPNYSPKTALAIPNHELARLGIVHSDVTAAQMAGYKAFADTGEALTWESVSVIETQALIEGGMPPAMAQSTVDQAIGALQESGVPGPTRIPWGSE